MKKRANSQKGLKLEHVSEATAAEWGRLSDLGRTPEPRLEADALRSLFLPVPPTPQQRSATERDWPSPRACGSGREMKHFWVSELSKRLGCSAWPESRKRRGAGVARPPPGARVPLKMCSCSIWGSGRRVLRLPLQTGFFSSWEGRHGGEALPPPWRPRHPEARPGQPGGSAPWVRVASSFPFGGGKRGAGPPRVPLLPEAQQMGNRGEAGAPLEVLSSLGREWGVSFQHIKKINP